MARLAEQHRYVELCAALAAQSPAERREALRALCAAGTEDPHVLFLLQWRWALPPDPDRDRSGEHMGRYTLCELLAEGGGGIVYRAEQHIGPHRREVAVKLLHPTLLQTARQEALARFLAEMGTLIKLEHDGIARIYDGGLCEDHATHDPLPYIAMELVREGLPLTTYARDYALAWPERLTLFLRVCRAVQYAHEHRVVHRDLKPANILVDPEGRPVVMDFGLAQAYDALLPGGPRAASGTPAYMSPEQVSEAFGAVSAKSDVYALGLILYELLTEQLPYVLPHGGAVEEWCQVMTAAVPPPLRQYSPAYGGELEAIVAAALAKRPADRLSVAALRSRLERFLQQLPPASDRPGRSTTQPDLDQASVGSSPPPVQPEQSTTVPPLMGTASGLGAVGPVSPDAERRQLTILFCDLVDSTQLAGYRDPEDWREVVRAYQQTCAEVIQRFDGSIAQWLGDGFLVYFGWPQAHEDDALRAVRTGLGLLEAMGPLNTRLAPAHGLRLALRIGIHTGLVVVGEMGGGGRQERLALGDTPNIASRLQGLATPDTIVISAATFHLVEGYITVEDLGRQALKGVATPLQAYQVVGATTAQSRMEVAATGLTPLVGRDADVALLRERWAQSRDGHGQVVLLYGEPGIGKSRLVEELTAHVRSEGAQRMLFRCSPYHTHSAFFPVIVHLQRRLHWHQDEAPEARVTTLEQALQPYGFALQDVVPLFAALLSVPLPERYPPLTLSPQRQKQQTQEALVTWLLAEAERQPVLVVWEDLHWADPSSLDFLRMLIDQAPTAPLLILLACRPEFTPPWPARSHVTQLTLARFTRPQIEAMVRHRTGGKPLPPEVVQQISAKTDGVPLFVEELTKAIVESGLLRETAECYELTGPLPVLAIPTTLQDALMARLDRLGTAKGLAQLGATIGRQFAYALLREVAQRDDMTMQRELGRVVEAELLYQRGLPPLAIYRFKHALIQDAAYQSLLKSTRQQVHQRIAQVVEAQFPDTVETQPEFLAHHYTAAGLSAQALIFWKRAGERALGRSAYREAVGSFEQALHTLQQLPETHDTHKQAIDVRIALCRALHASGDSGRILAYLREAEALAGALDDPRRLAQVSALLSRQFHFMGAYNQAIASAQRALALAASDGDIILHALANLFLGLACRAQGNYCRAIDYLRQTVASLDRTQYHEHFGLVGLPVITSRAFLATCHAELGMFTEGRALGEEGLRIAEAVADPASLLEASWGLGLLALCQGDLPRALSLLKQAVGICQEADLQGFFHFIATPLVAAYALAGRAAEAMALLTQVGGDQTSHYLGMAQLAAGRLEEAHALAERRLARTRARQERGHQGYALLLLGDIAAQREPPERGQAEAHYQQALALAHALGMRPLQAHCHRGLGTLYATVGQREQARAALSTAIDLYRAMDMAFWLPQTEAALVQVEGQ